MKTGRLARGWQIAKSSWNVLKLDKELALIPLMSSVATIFIVAGLYAITIAGLSKASQLDLNYNGLPSYTASPWVNIAIGVVIYFVITLVANFFSAAIIYGATQRFNGIDPTVKSSLNGARRKFYPLAGFSLLMSTVGLALQTIENRLPFGGAVVVWLVNAAWSTANIFAVPVIVLSEGSVHPFEATKQSVQIIKKIWGESVVANIGISLIGLLSVVGYSSLAVVIVVASAAAHLPIALTATLGVLAVMGLIAITVILAALGAIAKAALYHYAVTGAAPQMFDAELLRASITYKKARKIFS